MESVLDIHMRTGKFHHGYLLCGNLESACREVLKAAKILLETNNLESHPDYFYKTYDLLGIDDSHIIKYKASQRPLLGKNKVFILEVSSTSREAENALLKLFEEPTFGTYFFIIASSKNIFLPTLLSRLMIIKSNEIPEVPEEFMSLAKKFLSSTPKKRFDIINNLEKDKEKIISLLNALEVVMEKSKSFSALEEISRARKFILDKAASLKMILEHLALVTPRVYN